MSQDARRSPLELVTDAFQDASALLSAEAKLLRAEVSEKISKAVAAVGMMVGAAVFLLGALFLLLQTGVALLVQWGLSAAVASSIMAAVSAIIGIGLFLAGKSALSADNLTPKRSMNQINRDVAMAREAAAGR